MSSLLHKGLLSLIITYICQYPKLADASPCRVFVKQVVQLNSEWTQWSYCLENERSRAIGVCGFVWSSIFSASALHALSAAKRSAGSVPSGTSKQACILSSTLSTARSQQQQSQQLKATSPNSNFSTACWIRCWSDVSNLLVQLTAWGSEETQACNQKETDKGR